eukprot:scaffold12227_cov65-Phaeocystis_antarctica.AAC.2
MVVERQLTLQAAKAALKRVPPQRAAPSPTRRPPVTSPPPQALVSRVEPSSLSPVPAPNRSTADTNLSLYARLT